MNEMIQNNSDKSSGDSTLIKEGKKVNHTESKLHDLNNSGIPFDGESSNVGDKSVTLKTLHETKSKEDQAIDEANLQYDEDGVCIYTDPESKYQFVWDEGKLEWVSRTYPSSIADKDYEYDGHTYTYIDKETNVKYSWDVDKNEWKVSDSKVERLNSGKPKKKEQKNEEEVNEEEESEEEGEDEEVNKKKAKEITKQDMSKGHYGFENDTHTYTDPSDGSKYLWDKEKNAWFPKVDDDFLAKYQMSYGFIDPNENHSQPENSKVDTLLLAEVNSCKRKAPQEPAWFDVGEESTKVYVSGLPLDITEAEFLDVMQKCGLVMREIEGGRMKIKIYLDPHTSLPKGDALCTYIKKESVDLALNLLDGYDVRGHRITVQRAKFTMKGNSYDPSLKPKKKRKKDKEKLKKIQEKLFDWRPDKMRGERSRHEKTVIIKNLFEPDMFNKDVKLILEYQQDLREECIKCGAVKKVTIYDRHREGVAQITFKEFEAADACVQLLNGRWFGQRKLSAEIWDGKTKYKISETDEQIRMRLAKWEKFLESVEPMTQDNTESGDKPDMKSAMDEKIIKKECQSKDEPEVINDCENVKSVTDEMKRDSDQDTRSSVGSDYETDDEMKTS